MLQIVKLDPKKKIKISFDSCEVNCNISGLRLIILEEDSVLPQRFFTITDIIKLDDINTNHHGLLTIGPVKNSQLYHQFKYDPDLLHGMALQYNEEIYENHTENLERFLSENP